MLLDFSFFYFFFIFFCVIHIRLNKLDLVEYVCFASVYGKSSGLSWADDVPNTMSVVLRTVDPALKRLIKGTDVRCFQVTNYIKSKRI